MTHGVLCLIDENNFLIHSEPIPLMTEYGLGQPISARLKDGFAYKPGLLSLVGVAESVIQNPTGNSPALKAAIQAAKATCQKPVDEELYSTAIDRLRREIRILSSVPESQLTCLNYFQE